MKHEAAFSVRAGTVAAQDAGRKLPFPLFSIVRWNKQYLLLSFGDSPWEILPQLTIMNSI